MARFVLTVGHIRAQHVSLIGEGLLDLGHEVAAIFLVSALQPMRIRALLRQRGWAWVVNRLRRTGSGGLEADEWAALKERYHFPPESVRLWGKARSVPVISVMDLNSAASIRRMRRIAPDAVIYGGGGILRSGFISASMRVLNAHAGPLPEIRGMNAAEWALVLGERPEVTVHLIDGGIDTGPVLVRQSYSREGPASLEELRARAVVAGVRGLLRTVDDGLWAGEGTVAPEARAYRQCFVMAPALRELAESRLLCR